MTATFPAVLTAPETDVFTDYDGVPVAFVGDGGTMVALGHHNPDAARAAFHRHDIWDRIDLDVLTTWAVLCDPPAGEDDTSPWFMEWGVDEGTPGAFPVMVVEA